MKNFEQIRAKNALSRKIGTGTGGGDSVAKKVPVMIRDNGIIAAAAFALETKAGYEDVFNAVIAHLADQDIKLLNTKMQLNAFIDYLVSVDSDSLRAITAETMAYLNYLRRFA